MPDQMTRLARLTTTSHVATAVARVATLIGSLAARSAVVTTGRRTWGDLGLAWGVSATERGTTRTHHVVRTARTTRLLARLATQTTAVAHAATQHATTTHYTRTLTRYGECSFLYRWLTTEPEPDVIVIDLRDTYTAGPVIDSLDRTIARLTPGVHSARLTHTLHHLTTTIRDRPLRYLGLALLPLLTLSFLLTLLTTDPQAPTIIAHAVLAVLALLATQSTHSYDDLRDTRTAQYLAAAFEPPEPPTPHEPNHHEHDPEDQSQPDRKS